MTDVTLAIEQIRIAAKAHGLPELARVSGIPYTTLVDWDKADWRPRSVKTLERLATAAATLPAPDTPQPAEAV